MFFFFSFFFYKIREQEGRTVLAWGIWYQWEGKRGGVNIMQMLCAHICKCKNDTCLHYSRNGGVGGGGIKQNGGEVEFNYNIFDTL
jgi:hypothetical protein